MDIAQLSLEQYEAFLEGKDYGFLQSAGAVRNSRMKGFDTRIYAGMKEGKPAIAIIVKLVPAGPFHLALAPRDYVCERYDDYALVKDFFAALKPVLAKDKVLALKMESGIERISRDGQGNETDAYNHEDFRRAMEQAGLKPSPLWADGYDFSHQCRWVSILDLASPQKGIPNTESVSYLTEGELMKNLSYKTRQDVRASQRPYIVLEKLGRQDLHYMKEMEDASAKLHDFSSDSLDVYETFFDAYQDQCQVWMSVLDLGAYQTYLHQEKEAADLEMTKAKEEAVRFPDSKKKQNKVITIQERLDSLDRKQAEAQNLAQSAGERVPLAAALFLTTPTETIYLFGGSKRELAHFKGSYALQWKMIKDSLARGALRYNFWGISGRFDPQDPSYGVFDFKKGFGARVAEYCGEFVLPVKPVLYKTYSILKK